MNPSASAHPDSPRQAPGSSARPSLARTSISTAATERTLSSNAAYAGWEQSTDIRGDVALGWGEEAASDDDGGTARAGPSTSHAGDAVDPGQGDDESNMTTGDEWGWRLHHKAVHPVSPFYPMDPRSTRRIHLTGQQRTGGEEEDTKTSVHEISQRISKACQSLSVYGIWDNGSPSTTLSSMERVEMEITIYLDDAAPQVVLVELQRRKGCSIAFHTYRRCLLDAAEGKFDADLFKARDGLETGGRDRTNQPRASLKRPGLGRPSLGRPSMARPSLRSPSSSADNASTPIAGLKIDGENPRLGGERDENTVEKALKALNMAASLITKDRVDAQTLGMQSLVLLTDPLRAGMDTAQVASQVVLLGSAIEDTSMNGDEDDVDALFDDSAGLGIREIVLEMIMTDSASEQKMTSEEDGSVIEKEFTDTLVNLCLTVLSNALTATEPFARGVSKRFIDDTNSTFGGDVLSSLVGILGQAKTNPHDAYHAARCLAVLFKGCGNSQKARARHDLDAKRITAVALEVGSRSHAKLEDASRVAMMALVTDD